MLTPLKKLVTSACYDKQHVCFYARRANSSKITTFQEGTPLWHPRAQACFNLGGRDLIS